MKMDIKERFDSIRRAITLYGEIDDGTYHMGNWSYTPLLRTIEHTDIGDVWSATMVNRQVILHGIGEAMFTEWVECSAVPVLTLRQDGEEAIAKYVKENTEGTQRVLTTLTKRGSLTVWSTDTYDVVYARIFGENEFVYFVMEEGVTEHIVNTIQRTITPTFI